MRHGLGITMGALSVMAAGVAEAEPYLAAREGKSCLVCHISSSGTGMRNMEGREFSRAIAFPKDEGGLHLEEPRLNVGDVQIEMGGDIRTQLESSKNSDSFTLPQAAWYSHVRLADRADLVYSADFSRTSPTKEMYGLVRFDETWSIKAGQFTLPYGLLTGDPRSLLSQGSGFGTHVQDVGVEVNGQVRAESTEYFVRGALTNGTGVGNHVRAGTVQMGMHTPGYTIGLSSQLHRGDTGDRWRYGTFAWTRLLPFVLLYELDGGQDPITSAVPLLTYTSLEVDLSPVIHAGVAYETWDPDMQVTGDDRQRTALQLRWFPVPFVETLVTAAAVTRATTGTSYEGSLSLHFYY